MDQSFEGKPVFVDHVDGVEESIDELRKEADGWVIKSFYNAADGKHWVEFIVVSERGLRGIQNGMRLSNAYHPTSYRGAGIWNGVPYEKEIVAGDYEHLAIVQNPRYAESIILSPEEFKAYNASHEIELKRLANSQDQKGEDKMNLKFFKRAKVENSVDLESTVVELPKSKKEYTIAEIVNKLDVIENMHGYASDDHMVKVGENEMSVKDLVKQHMSACNELAEMKKPKEENAAGETLAEDEKDVGDRGGDANLNAEKEEEAKKEEAKKNAIVKAQALKNAAPKFTPSAVTTIDLPQDKLARGRELF